MSAVDRDLRDEPARPSRAELLARFFKDRPFVWLDGRELEIAGRYAWRTRISDLRRGPYFMTIENRQRRVKREDGTSFTVSEYRFVPDSRVCETNYAAVMTISPRLF